MRRTFTWIVLSLTATGALNGCIERTLFITSEPTGALVHLNDVEVGVTPVEVGFTWYGVYDVSIEKDGYEPLTTTAEAKSPAYELPVIDLFVDALPGTRHSDIHWSFTLTKADEDPDAVVERAKQMRAEAFETAAIKPGDEPKK